MHGFLFDQHSSVNKFSLSSKAFYRHPSWYFQLIGFVGNNETGKSHDHFMVSCRFSMVLGKKSIDPMVLGEKIIGKLLWFPVSIFPSTNPLKKMRLC